MGDLSNLERLIQYSAIPLAIIIFGSASDAYTTPIKASISSAYMKAERIYRTLSELVSGQDYNA